MQIQIEDTNGKKHFIGIGKTQVSYKCFEEGTGVVWGYRNYYGRNMLLIEKNCGELLEVQDTDCVVLRSQLQDFPSKV